jgi:long-chain fatty acid transport protein
MRYFLTVFHLLIFFFSASLPARGSGFEIRTKTITGTALAGSLTALHHHSSASVYNPAAMGFLPRRFMISTGLISTFSKTSYFETGSSNIQSDHPLLWTPSLSSTFQINNLLSAGLAYYSSFGYHHRWDDNWTGRFVTRQARLQINTIHPSVSFTFADMYAFSVSALIYHGRYQHRKALHTGNNEGEARVNAQGSGIGFMLAAFLKYNDNLSAGLTIQWNGNMIFRNVTTEYSQIPLSWKTFYTETDPYRLTLRLPYRITAGGSLHFNPDLVATAEISYTGWKRLDSIYMSQPVTDAGPVFLRLYNTFSGRLGVQYTYVEEFSLNGGVAYDITPFGSDHLIPAFPDANKIFFSVGAQYSPKPRFAIEAVAGLENLFERKGYDTENFLYGSYNSVRYLLGIGMSYHF